MFGTARILRRPRWRWRVALALICAAGAVASVWIGSLVIREQRRELPRDYCRSTVHFDWEWPAAPCHTLLRESILPIELYYMGGWFVVLTTQPKPSVREITLDYTDLAVQGLVLSRGVAWPVRSAIPGRKGVYLVAAWLPPFALLTLIGVVPLISGSVRTLRMGHRRRRGRCAACGYSLTGLSEQRCPECGTPGGAGNTASV